MPENLNTTRQAVAAAIALVLAAAGLVLASTAEFAAGDLRGDGDNAADGIAYLQAVPQSYANSGAGLLLGGAALVVGVVGYALLLRRSGPSLPLAAGTAIGALAGGLLVLAGSIRLQSTGTVPYIASLDPEWGESAYLAVHLAGTQGALSAGAYLLAGWMLTVAIIALRRRVRWLLVAAVAPAVLFTVLLSDVVVQGMELPDFAYPVTIICLLVGLPLGCLLLASALFVPASRARLAAPVPARET